MNNLQQTIIERYTEKKFNSQDFKYRDYIELRKKLIKKNEKADKKIAKEERRIATIENAPDTRIVTVKEYDDILSTTALATTATAALVALGLDASPVNVCGASLAGVLAGVLLGHANIAAYGKQPLTNAICKGIVKSKNNKIKKLNNQKELRNYTLYCFRQQENDNKPSYEDYLRAVNENGEELAL